jgi:hypothetical protein
MVYNTSTGGITSVRMETGNLLPADFPDTEITINLENAYSKVQLAVKRLLTDPFISTDAEYGTAREIEKMAAAMYSLKPYSADPNVLAKVQDLDKQIDKGILFLKENVQETADTGDVTILYAVTPYLSFGAAMDEDPTQTTRVPYRSGLTDDV